MLESSLLEINLTNCGPGRRSALADEFFLELESIRVFIRKNAHCLSLYDFSDGDDNSLASPAALKGQSAQPLAIDKVIESNTTFLEKSKRPFSELAKPASEFHSIVLGLYSALDSDTKFRAWFSCDVKGKLSPLEGWTKFSNREDDFMSFGICVLPVIVLGRWGHLVRIRVSDSNCEITMEAEWLEEDNQIDFRVDLGYQLYPGQIIAVPNYSLRTLSDSNFKFGTLNCKPLNGLTVGFVVDHDVPTGRVMVASPVRSTSRLTDVRGSQLGEDHKRAKVVRDYFDIITIDVGYVRHASRYYCGVGCVFPCFDRSLLDSLAVEGKPDEIIEMYADNTDFSWDPSRGWSPVETLLRDSRTRLKSVEDFLSSVTSKKMKQKVPKVIVPKRERKPNQKNDEITEIESADGSIDQGVQDVWDAEDYEARKIIVCLGEEKRLVCAFFLK
jgi:hypothetical protein